MCRIDGSHLLLFLVRNESVRRGKSSEDDLHLLICQLTLNETLMLNYLPAYVQLNIHRLWEESQSKDEQICVPCLIKRS